MLTIAVLAIVGAVIMIATFVDRQIPSLWALAGPLRFPWAMIAIATLTGAFVSPYPDLTLPKLCGVMLGMMILRAVLLTATTSSRTWALAWAYLVVGSGIVLAGLSGLQVSPLWLPKYETLYSISSKIPRVIPKLAGAEDGVNPNGLGGTTLFFLPLVVVVAVHRLRVRNGGAATRKLVGREVTVLEGPGYVLGAAFLLVALVLSQSRSAWISAAAAGAVVVALRFRPRNLAWAIGATAALAGWLWSDSGAGSRIPGPDRMFFWSMACEAIRAHPLVGVGLGAFRRIGEDMQGAHAAKVVPVAHAHNVFLQVALDIGIPGLIAYIALIAVASGMAYQILRRHRDTDERAMCLGLWASLIAVHLFGLTDAISLGAKVGIFLWWNLGLIAAVHYRMLHPVPAVNSRGASSGVMSRL
jgi:putative inorganic carbon (HCO3(-)) transporter